MPDIGVDVEGVDDFASGLETLRQRMRSATRKATRDGTKLLEREVHARLSRYSHAPGTPTPSPPGQPPARISGRLRGSLSPTGPVPVDGGFSGWLGPTEVYSRIQELGGVAGRGHSVTLPPRPYVGPVVHDSRDKIRDGYRAAWERAL